jgi:hypothetical protein
LSAIKNISIKHKETGYKLACILFCFFSTQLICGQNWQAMASPLSPVPTYKVLYSDSIDNYLYVGGHFSSINGLPTKCIARWNGSGWDSLDIGVDELAYPNSNFCYSVNAITRYQGEIYIGGDFKSAGNVYARSIAKWNGITWDSLSVQPFSTNQRINELTVIDNKLYIGGLFTSIAGQPCKMFAMWDGSSNTWNPIGLPTELVNTNSVNTICEYQGEIYVGGNFNMSNGSGDTIRAIIRWDGANWKSVGGGMKGTWSIVNDLKVYNGELYVGGDFYKADGNKSNAIQKWDGTQWSEVGGGMSGPGTGAVWDMTVHESKLYVVGMMEYAGGIAASKIAVWDGNQWCGFGSTFDGVGGAVGFYNDTLYMSGGFWTIDGDSIYRIAKWLGGDNVANCATYSVEDENLNFIKIYPNPAENYITIVIDDWELLGAGSYAIYNLLGEQVKMGGVNQAQTDIEIFGISPGMYTIEIIIGNKKVNKKILKI